MTDLTNYATLSYGDLVDVCEAKGIDTENCDAEALRTKLADFVEPEPKPKKAKKK